MNSRKTRHLLLALGCAGLLAVAAGCGGGEDGESATDVAQAYVDARNEDDAAALCNLYTDDIQQQTVQESCESFVRRRMSEVGGAKVTLVTVDEQGDYANAVISSTGKGSSAVPASVPLQRQGDEWKVGGFDLLTGL